MNTKVRFPKRRPDGSFCILACFHVASGDPVNLKTELDAWFRQWVQNNQTWTWTYETGEQQTFSFTDEFSGVPVPVLLNEHEVGIRFEGQPTAAKFWKDWLALKIVPDIRSDFQELGDLTRIVDCDD